MAGDALAHRLDDNRRCFALDLRNAFHAQHAGLGAQGRDIGIQGLPIGEDGWRDHGGREFIMMMVLVTMTMVVVLMILVPIIMMVMMSRAPTLTTLEEVVFRTRTKANQQLCRQAVER